ncbi:non-ribosomal peptide synthetase [Teichococcus vastitatis]|uniref:non-ribosomal peptide synthetase n=1 Tax=Teichococcus vastitatis TaxID=2307076 RepID=UPI000E74CC27|nr:non-ribosomal peptide synthetase [Pseudoroseomonas vastitatis]
MSPPTARPVPLTEAQAGLWFAQQLDPANPIFNTGQYIDLAGPLDVAAFSRAVNGAVSEADALALRIGDHGGTPVQWVEEARRPWLQVIDLSTEPDPEGAARAAMAADMARPPDPARHALAAQCLYVLGPVRHLWYQRAHHLALDAFGTDLMVRRVASLYAAALGRGIAGPPLAGFDVALAEDAAYRDGAQKQKDAEYWRQAMEGLAEVAGLASGRAVTGRQALRHSVLLHEDLAAALRTAAAANRLPWPDLVAALVAAYVRRHAGTADVSIGVALMGRLGSPAARVACTLMNVVPFRLTPDEDAPLAGFLAQAAGTLLRGRRHGRYRGEQLRRDLGLLGAGRRLYGALVNLLPFDGQPILAGLQATRHVLGTGPVDDITLTFRGDPGAAGLRLEIEANPGLYEAADLAAHASRLPCFIRAALAAERLSVVPTATPTETRWLLNAWNATSHPIPGTSLATLLAARMAARPEVPALEFNGTVLSYAALDARTAALAAALQARGARRGRIVAVALERSVELVVALLAVIRTGAAYLPLDATHPTARILRILEDAAPVLALAEEPLPGGIPVLAPRDWPLEGGAPPDSPAPDDLAYVLYTSGSTGAPKGVAIEHRAIVNRLEWMREHYGFGPGDRILQKTPATFDVSVWEFFLAFLCGGTLVVAPPGAHKDPAALAALLRGARVTTAHFVPSMLAAFLAEPASAGLALRHVFCSGEELTADLRDRFHSRITAELHNLYGPTEAAVDVSAWPAAREDRSRPVPIGHPVWNTQLYVLDEALRPVPPGVTGELYLGGVQLARGYLGQPELTARAFLRSPFRAGERIYRTGDLARRRTDGAVVFLGRADQQVKIRGQRIELGEVETALAGYAGLRQARVILREDRPGDQRLVAYVVPGKGFDAAALRAHAAARLPDAMLPCAFVTLAALPVNGSGKLDRAALPEPNRSAATGRIASDETERRVADLFSEVLGVDGIGAEDDFFALGGHSLLAVELMLRVREIFGWDPGLGTLFEHPSVERLAALLKDSPVSDSGLGPIVRLQQGDEELAPLFAVHPAGGISWCYGGLARALSPRRTVYGLQAPALADGVATAESLDALAENYARRIDAIWPHGVVHLLGWSVGGIIAHAMAVRLRALGRRVGVLAMLDSYPSEVWRQQEEPADHAPYRALLAIGGHDPERLRDTVPLTREAVLAFLRAENNPLGQLLESALDGVVRVVRGNNRLVRRHEHERYDGVITHFHAAAQHATSAISPALWHPYAAAVEVVDVAAHHAELTGAAATAQIAPFLAARLAAFDMEEH